MAIVTTDAALGPYGYVDSGAYLSVLLLAAQSLGIAAVPQAAIAMYSDLVRQHFDLPEDRLVLLGVSFGYADVEHPVNQFRTTRASVSEAVRRVGG
ncbi:nitroreductase family protein [Aeromicrobium sp. UC242_57]|uniref:nitroreductase family protein n=1 Tax=Aeromicrobium sp. UC242_57 TaxID=3374624 RepID=UPI0037A5E018